VASHAAEVTLGSRLSRLVGLHEPTAAVGPPANAAHGRRLLVDSGLRRCCCRRHLRLGVELLAPRLRFRDDVLEVLHLLGEHAACILEHPHAGGRRFHGQRSEHAGYHGDERSGGESEHERQWGETHGGLRVATATNAILPAGL